MKIRLPLIVALFSLFFLACSRKNYQSSLFEQQTADHRIIAILPAHMIFTGTKPQDLTEEDIKKIEENESRSFQQALFVSLLNHANSRKYTTTVNFQDVSRTLAILEKNNISIRDSWGKDDKELADILEVDAVVRMRIEKKRYMSDLASYGVTVGKQILNTAGLGSKIPLPYNAQKTNDIYASCNLLSENITLWNDNYKGASDWNTPANEVIENITDRFGRNFPYKRRR